MASISRRIDGVSDLLAALPWVYEMAQRGLARGPVVVTLGRETRSTEQNKRLWAMLTDLSAQVDWYGSKLTPEEWKDVCTAALRKQRAVPGIDGGFVVLGMRTSKMNKAEMSELQDLIEAFGNQQGVKWTAPEEEP